MQSFTIRVHDPGEQPGNFYLFVYLCRLHRTLVAAFRASEASRGLSSCWVWAQLPCSMWDLSSQTRD